MQSTTSNTKHNHIRSHLPLPSNTNTTSTAETKIDTLYHETLGTGPPLLLIPGAHSTGLIYTNLAQQLSRYFRVTLYDLRGFARSFSSSSVRTTLQTHIDDAKTLIHHITASPTPDPKKPNKKRYRSIHIFSSSSSASIALSLLKNPDIHIKNLILHEPVLPTLLPRPYLTHIQTQLQLHVFSPARPCMAEINRHLVSMTQTREGWEDFKRTDAYKAIERFPGDYSLGFFGDVLPDVLEWEVDVGMVREWMGGEGHGGGGKLALVRGKVWIWLGSGPVSVLGREVGVEVNVVGGDHLGFVSVEGAREVAGFVRGVCFGDQGDGMRTGEGKGRQVRL